MGRSGFTLPRRQQARSLCFVLDASRRVSSIEHRVKKAVASFSPQLGISPANDPPRTHSLDPLLRRQGSSRGKPISKRTSKTAHQAVIPLTDIAFTHCPAAHESIG